ncbi:hypothetical protein [Burkholderia gladioli]|uniref:hypothetical protein n=1 Tax=Burkholderia gladioli TaxID=28095 RepID=UPI0016404DC5|nr:hypothetical protein [Burkholderia gladioli]
MPVKYWTMAVGFLLALVAATYSVVTSLRPPCSLIESQSLAKEAARLNSEIDDLIVRRETLKVEVQNLEIDKKIKSMTPEERAAELKKWTR